MSFKLSPSSLALFKDCPRCFWLAKHKVWSRPSGAFPSLPSGMDKVLKEHFDRFRDKGQLPPELCSNSDCEKLKLFDDKDLLKIWRNNFKGITWEDKDGNILHGAIDNLLVKGKRLIVMDFKTRGFPCKDDTHEHYRDQLDIYNFLLRKNDYETEDYAFLLFYIPKEVLPTGEVIFDSVLKKMSVDTASAEKLFKGAVKSLNGECPKKTCVWCEKV